MLLKIEARTAATVWNIVPRGSSGRSLLFFCAIFFRPLRLSLAPTICPWVSEDGRNPVSTRLVFRLNELLFTILQAIKDNVFLHSGLKSKAQTDQYCLFQQKRGTQDKLLIPNHKLQNQRLENIFSKQK